MLPPVLLYHVDSGYLPGGFAGVDIFFVISGFVVTGSLLKPRAETSGTQFLLDFYSRRVKRLTPSLLVVTTSSAIAFSVVLPPNVEKLDEH